MSESVFNPLAHLYVEGPQYDDDNRLVKEELEVQCNWCSHVYVEDACDLEQVTPVDIFDHMSSKHPEMLPASPSEPTP